MITDLLGLWKSEETQWYSSETIKKAELAKMAELLKPEIRIVMRKNKFYEKGTNRPQYIFAFADSESAANKTILYSNDDWQEIGSLAARIEDCCCCDGDSGDDMVARFGEIRNLAGSIRSYVEKD